MRRFLLPGSALFLCAALFLAPLAAAYPDDTTPQQPVWASALSACMLLSALLCSLAGGVGNGKKMSSLTFAGLILWMGVSALARLAAQHSIAYIGPMLHGLATWAVFGTAFALCAHLSRKSKMYFYAIVGAILAASAWAANDGLREYLVAAYAAHAHGQAATWRVFGTSTPDFTAAYFVLLIPLTLVVLLRLPSGKRMNSPLLGIALPGLAGLILLMQTMTLLATGSRFALVGVAVGAGTCLAALLVAVRRGLTLEKATRLRLIVLAVVVLLPALVVARPVLARLSNLHDNSGAFRLWTWRGAVRMASANPLVGTGVGTWQDTYPHYALVGFTRLAHNSYLQMTDECGLPGVLILLTVLGLIVRAGTQRTDDASIPEDMPPAFEEKLPSAVPRTRRAAARSRPAAKAQAEERKIKERQELFHDPLLRCGLLGAVAGGIVQNLIDSDWYVFFFGLTFWAMAGLLVGLSDHEKAKAGVAPSLMRRMLLLGGLAVPCAYFIAQTVASSYSLQGRAARNAQDAQTSFALAQVWDGLNARHHTDMAARVYNPVGNYPAAEAEIRQAVRLLPSSGNFLRLGRVLAAQRKMPEALAAFQSGLAADPNSVDLLLEAARLSPDSRRYYQRLADLETGPVGAVRAIGEIVEVKFAYADAALGLYARAARLLEAYAQEGGSTNIERQALTGQPDPAQDHELRILYSQMMDGLKRTTPLAEQSPLMQRRQKTLALFDKLLAPPPDGVHSTAENPISKGTL